jgi:uncharacterized protein
VTEKIEHEERDHRGVFFIESDGRRVARMTYTRTNESLVIIDHTEVDPALSGQGVGVRLVHAAVAWARETGNRILTTCPFAKVTFERDPSLRDVLA